MEMEDEEILVGIELNSFSNNLFNIDIAAIARKVEEHSNIE